MIGDLGKGPHPPNFQLVIFLKFSHVALMLIRGTMLRLKMSRFEPCHMLPPGCSTSYSTFPTNSSHRNASTSIASDKASHSSIRKCLRCMSSLKDVKSTVHEDTSQSPLPSTLYGRVVGSSVGYVKVDLFHPSTRFVKGKLLPPDSNTPSSSLESSSLQEPEPWIDKERQAPRQLLCNLRSILKKLNKLILVGDYVEIGGMDLVNNRGTVLDLLPRNSEIQDPCIANVDHALLVFALHDPPFEELQVSRFLVSMEAFGLPFTLVLNKADLVSEREVRARVEQVRSWGYEPILVSCEQRWGLEEVGRVLRGRTSVVAGPSGAGKSSLINAIRLGRHKQGYAPATSLPPPSFILPMESEEGRRGIRAGEVQEESEGGRRGTDGDEIEEPKNQQDGILQFLTVGDVSKIGRGQHTTTTGESDIVSLPTSSICNPPLDAFMMMQ